MPFLNYSLVYNEARNAPAAGNESDPEMPNLGESSEEDMAPLAGEISKANGRY